MSTGSVDQGATKRRLHRSRGDSFAPAIAGTASEVAWVAVESHRGAVTDRRSRWTMGSSARVVPRSGYAGPRRSVRAPIGQFLHI